MSNIKLIANLDLSTSLQLANDIQATGLFSGPRRTIIEIRLQNRAVLAKHKASEPITVLCLSGEGVFRAGRELEDSQKLIAGTLITLEAEIEHEVQSDPAVHLVVTKFKAD